MFSWLECAGCKIYVPIFVEMIQEHLMLEPYSLKKDLLYIAIVPNQRTYSAAKVFLKEFSVIYEVMEVDMTVLY